jgi:hypothetical protein
MEHWTRGGTAFIGGLALAALLAACGGSDGPGSATVRAADDAATLDWRSTAEIDVLANDTVSRGTLSLAAVDTPANGSASIEGGRLRYTPAPGWFGTDSVRYTVRADDGGATASATLVLTVQARLALSGVITDAPVAGAAVTLRVGEQTIETTADDLGRYAAEVVSSEPAAWVQLSGVSTDGRVRLISIVGELGAVAAAADAESGAVGSDRLPALAATHWSSAEAALRARALGGLLPGDAAAMAATDGALRASELTTLATVVRMIADAGIALPAGSADSFALLLDGDATQAFVAAQVASDGGAAYRAVQETVLADAPLAAGTPWAVPQDRMFALVDTNPMTGSDLVFTLRPDGSARLSSAHAQGEGRWTADGATLQVTLDPPATQDFLQFWSDPITGTSAQLMARSYYEGFRLQMLTADGSGGTVLRHDQSRAVYLEGPPAGQVIWQSVDGPGWPVRVFDLAARVGVLAGDLGIGRRLAGLTAETVDPASGMTRDDILRIDGAGSATFEISGRAATWSLDDGWLTVNTAGAPAMRYTRLLRDPVTGLESWLAAEVPADPAAPVLYAEADVLFVQEGLVFDAATAARRWRSEGFLVANPDITGTGPNYVMQADGTMTAGATAMRWSIAGDGSLAMIRTRNGVDYPRQWIPLSRVGPHWVVLEIVDFGYVGQGVSWRINWQRDLGPAAD